MSEPLIVTARVSNEDPQFGGVLGAVDTATDNALMFVLGVATFGLLPLICWLIERDDRKKASATP